MDRIIALRRGSWQPKCQQAQYPLSKPDTSAPYKGTIAAGRDDPLANQFHALPPYGWHNERKAGAGEASGVIALGRRENA
ncbi:MAG: hypothetical protein HQ501_13700 [Rhodospirillales bacterium]|nr:hypothetical protein [Rhodospirillales bacterium]